MTERSDVETLGRALVATKDRVLSYPGFLSLISLGWVIGVIPLVTAGPVTLGAYCAVRNLREKRIIDRSDILRTVRSRLLPATAFGILPMILGSTTILYGRLALAAGSTPSAILAAIAGYATAYTLLLYVPVFVELADGEAPVSALKSGIAWTTDHPALAIVVGFLTLVWLAVTVVLTIGFFLLFAGFAFALHTEIVLHTSDRRAQWE